MEQDYGEPRQVRPGRAPVAGEPQRRVRLRLSLRNLKRDWASFASIKIGLIGLGIIVL